MDIIEFSRNLPFNYLIGWFEGAIEPAGNNATSDEWRAHLENLRDGMDRAHVMALAAEFLDSVGENYAGEDQVERRFKELIQKCVAIAPRYLKQEAAR